MNYNQDDVRLVARRMIGECYIYSSVPYCFSCVYCDKCHDDPVQIPHLKGCPVLVAKKLLEVK